MLSGCLGFLNGKTSFVTYSHRHLPVDASFLAKPGNTMVWGVGALRALVEGAGQMVKKVYLSPVPPGIRAIQCPKQLSSKPVSPQVSLKQGNDRVLW